MTVQRSFGLNRKSVAASRKFVGEAVTDLPDELRDAAILMMSELATNAIVHAATGFEVGRRSDDWLRIAVTDEGGGEPELRTPSSSEPHGRGLQIVKELSDEWGMIDNEDHSGKTVWYAVRLDRRGPSEDVATSTGQDVRGRADRGSGGPIRRQQKRGSDRSGTVKGGRAQSSSQTGCASLRFCRLVHRPLSPPVEEPRQASVPEWVDAAPTVF